MAFRSISIHQSASIARVSLAAMLAFLLLIQLSGCKKSAPPQPARPPAEVEVYPVKPMDIPVTYTHIGQTLASQDVEIRARVQGVIWDMSFTEGTTVTAGQYLYRIDPRPFEADAQIAEAQAYQAKVAVDAAKRDLDRTRRLQSSASVSQEELDNAQTAFETAIATQKLNEANVFKARLELSFTTVTAPVSGLVGKALKRPGDLVDTGTNSLLTNISVQEPIFVNFTISEKDMLEFRKNTDEGHIIVPDNSEYQVKLELLDKSMYDEIGRINFLDVKIDPQTGTGEFRAIFENKSAQLRPGQFVKVHIIGVERKNTVVIPQKAVMQGMQGSYVYVVDDKSHVEMRPVVTSNWEGNNWIIESGLKADEKVIITGTNKTAPSAEVKVTTVTTSLDFQTTKSAGQ